MLSIVLSGLNVSQKSLDVISNNMANAGTVGFKRSEASFQDVFANDPATGSKVAVGSGVAIGSIERTTSQGQLQTTSSVTDLAIAGRGYFTLLAKDPTTGITDTYYTRAGNFTINANGDMCDAQGNLLQVFAIDMDGNITKTLTNANIETEKPTGTIAVKLDPSAVKDTVISITLPGSTAVARQKVTQQDINSGFLTFAADGLTSSVAGGAVSTYPETQIGVSLSPLDSNDPTSPRASYGDTVELWSSPDAQGHSSLLSRHVLTLAEATASSPMVTFHQPVPDPNDPGLSDSPPTFLNAPVFTAKLIKNNIAYAVDDTKYPAMSVEVATVNAASEFRGVFVQNISISTKGSVQENYSDGTKRIIGAIALATFPNEAGLKPIGDTDFVACESSGAPTLTQAGAPYAGDIHSGTLEQANVDITQELMGMLKAQQIYNGNARMMQTEIEVTQRVTDKL